MSLTIKQIKLRNFRSYENFELNDIGLLTIFVGPNAVGKTNIIEGIQLITSLTSFRHPSLDQVIKEGTQSAEIYTEIADETRKLDIDLSIKEGAKRYLLNGKAKRPSDLKGLKPSVIFTPDDLNLVKGSMSVRRHALDALGSQLSSNYYTIRKDYEKILRHKNHLLKEEISSLLLESINETLVICGSQLVCYRAALFKKLAPYFEEYYANIVSKSEKCRAFYIPSWDEPTFWESSFGEAGKEEVKARFQAALLEKKEEEQRRRQALVGPHADRIEFLINNKNASLYGSQGQQRSIVLSFKLSEASLIEEILHQKPVLLLDDVMSELDSNRRIALINYIGKDTQTFITTTNLSYFDNDIVERARVIQLPAKNVAYDNVMKAGVSHEKA